MSRSFGQSLRKEFLLDDSIVFLNNGSFGATPKLVLEAQHSWQYEFEKQPIKFVMRDLPMLLRQHATTMANFMGAEGSDVVFIDNATSGVNAVLRSLVGRLSPGDELLTTSHVYNAVRQAMQYICSITGATYVEVPVAFPLSSPADVIDAVTKAITPSTRFAIFDHVTSPTGITFPVKELIELCRSNKILVMIDGAHAPGMLDLNLTSLNADWYTGNFHKWLFAPKGSAFLWTHPTHQNWTHPLNISHSYNQGYTLEFDFNGTKDWSSYLSATAGLEYFLSLGSDAVRSYTYTLAQKARGYLLQALQQPEPAPVSMMTSMASIVLPLPCLDPMTDWIREHDMLYDTHQIEVPIFAFDGKLLLRIAAQVFNHDQEYQHCAAILANTYGKQTHA